MMKRDTISSVGDLDNIERDEKVTRHCQKRKIGIELFGNEKSVLRISNGHSSVSCTFSGRTMDRNYDTERHTETGGNDPDGGWSLRKSSICWQ